MHVIVTGSAGKLGRAAVAALRKAGHRVVGLDVQGPSLPRSCFAPTVPIDSVAALLE